MGFKSNHLAVVWAVRAQPPPILKESMVQGSYTYHPSDPISSY